MTKELSDIIADTKIKLAAIEKVDNTEYLQTLNETKRLQKELLNASILDMPNLQIAIKEQLRVKENELNALSNNQREVELGYLKTYIREHYD